MRKKALILLMSVVMAASSSLETVTYADGNDDTIVLRVCNWEEYIDEGEWEEGIDLSEDNTIIGENSMVEDFQDWYYDTYGKKVEVEYSTFGTNEDLFNQLNLGDTYDVVCPSEYMIMKLLAKDELIPFDEDFFDESVEHNYYAKGVSPYIKDVFFSNEIDGKKWGDYAAGYMWGTTGIVYNPEEVSMEDASSWSILKNDKYRCKVTVKDNVRDSYFAALGIYNADKLLDEDFKNSPNYREELLATMNDVSKETIDEVEKILKDIKENVYAFETDAGKSDMVTGKIVANYQWSGDAVYTLDQAEEDGMYFNYAVPEESTNMWFDGWIMLKDGIDGDEDKKHAAQAFINFLSRPDNAVRNMYYIGYTSAIAGGDDSTIFDYLNWCYSSDEEEGTIEYNLDYFFSGEDTGEFVIIADESQAHRQLFAQYPSEDVINRSAVMLYFDDDVSVDVNQMWINVRCYNLASMPMAAKIAFIAVLLIVVGYLIKAIYNGRKYNG